MKGSMKGSIRLAAAVILTLAVGAQSKARAEDPATAGALEAVATTAVAVDRSWLYNDPTRIVAPGHAVGMTRLTYGGGSPMRAFAGNLGTAGALLELGGEVGLVDRVSAVAI